MMEFAFCGPKKHKIEPKHDNTASTYLRTYSGYAISVAYMMERVFVIVVCFHINSTRSLNSQK